MISQSMASKASANQAQASAISGIGTGLASGAAALSSGSSKKKIRLMGKSPSGLNIYAFEYINKAFGKGVWQGVMADEVPSDAVIKNFVGDFDGVDYSKIDVEFKQLSL